MPIPSVRGGHDLSDASYPRWAAVIAGSLAVGLGVVTVGHLIWLVGEGDSRLLTLVDRLLQDRRLLRSLGNTVRITSICLLFQFSAALLLTRFFRRIPEQLALLLILPVLLPPSSAALAWFLWLSPAIGPMNQWLQGLGLEPPLWFVDTVPMTLVAVAVDSWQWLPFIAVVLLFQSGRIPDRFFEQARLEGASEWHVWRSVTLPMLAPTVAVLGAIRVLDLVRLYDVIFVLFGGGGPGYSMETLSIYTLKLVFQPGNESYGALVALTYLFLAFAMLLLALKVPHVRALMPWRTSSSSRQ